MVKTTSGLVKAKVYFLNMVNISAPCVWSSCHNKRLVCGDLRPPNVLFSGGKVFLIDFDWAGKEGEARYPRGLSRSVTWAAGAQESERQLIEPKHDAKVL